MARNEENPVGGQSSLESLMQRPVPVPPPGSYPVPNQVQARGDDGGSFDYNFGNLSIKDKKEQIEITRNSLELLSSMLNTDGKPNHTEVISLMQTYSMCDYVASVGFIVYGMVTGRVNGKPDGEMQAVTAVDSNDHREHNRRGECSF